MAAKRILVIAGSDSSGGAGLEADQKVIAAHGCYAMTATTALTAQNTQGVFGIHEIPSSFVEKQIQACIEDIGVDVVKTGMLASADTIRVVGEALRRHCVPISVIDPVMVATSGAQLLPEAATQTLLQDLLPLTTILTPNIPEAELLLRAAGREPVKIQSSNDLIETAKSLHSLGPKWVLLKGGHLPFTKERAVSSDDAEKYRVIDVLYGGEEPFLFESDYLSSKNTHGTGCSLASAIASNLASGHPIPQAVKLARQYVAAGIRTSSDMGKGSGPINHFHSTYTLPFAPGHFVEYLLDRADVQGVWKAFTEHNFVKELANASLSLKAFKHYLIQDYLYLIQFARANALAAYKAKTMDDIAMSASIVNHIHEEMSLHLSYCEEFGLSRAEVENHEESQACVAYTRYILDIGQSEDWVGLQAALAPCLLGYGAIGRRLYDDPQTKREGNMFWKWIENYVAEDFVQAVKTGSALLEKHVAKQSPSRIEELVKIFVRATQMEACFWDMAVEEA